MANTKKQEVKVEGPSKVLLYMASGASYVTGSGVNFTKDHPYQLVPEEEADILLREERFRLSNARDLKEFYQLGEAPISLPLTTSTFVNGDPIPEQ